MVSAVSVVSLASLVTVVGGASGFASADEIPGTLYKESNQASSWVAANPSDPRMPAIRDKIASRPVSHWVPAFDLDTVASEVSSVTSAAAEAGQIAVLTPYAIPNRDCSSANSGVAPDLTQYQEWISRFSSGLGSQPVIVIVEPDSIALQTCLSSADADARNQAIGRAVQTMKAANPKAKVYLDAGHSNWNPASVQAARLQAAGMQHADGFFSNASAFQPTQKEIAYGREINSALESAGITGKHQIIDTSRNGGAAGDWCGDDNDDRRLGAYPTLDTGDATLDGYLWIKLPGESDGCEYQAGTFVPELAHSLVSDAP